jgi:hypothetical protein
LKRSWIGLALLSASWLFGLSYYHDTEWLIWTVLVAVGTGLLIGIHIRRPAKLEAVASALMLLPAIYLAHWPYKAALILFFIGLVLFAAPIPRRWPEVFASAAVLAGIILLSQALAMLGYEYVTARSHELPQPLSYLLYAVSQALGIHAAFDGSNLALYTPRIVHLLGATWELFLNPVTFCFLIGGIVMLCLNGPAKLPNGKKSSIARQIATLIIVIAAWLPFRAAILISIFMHRALRTEYDSALALVSQFWNPWIHLALLLGPILLILRFVNAPLAGHKFMFLERESVVKPLKRFGVIALTFAGSFMLMTGIFFDMPGQRKQGRVMVDEYHSDWEPTDRPFDTEYYGQESGYNYACIYDYCSRFYEMSRLDNPIDDAVLQSCDVFMVKVPTSRYEQNEIAAIERFVERGGGLMLVGEHTNVFNTGIFINDIAKVFGIRFCYDCLFDIDTTFFQLYNLPLVPHPIIQNMPPLNFAVSCSINPGVSSGRAVIRSTGLKNLPADYHTSNFYPQVEDRAEMRYGSFVQLWAARHGAGRVIAFTDSTIFSNFATFEPGKAELMLGMLEWLNHSNPSFNPQPLLVLFGILILAVALILSRNLNGIWVIFISAALFGWANAAVSTRLIHRYSIPLPQAKRPMVKVVIDRTVCDAPLSRSGFIAGEKNGFGIFERWILRLGYFTSRQQGKDTLMGELIVFTYPNLTVKDKFRENLVSYVKSGGKVLILDSPENTESTANSLLYPFGISLNQRYRLNGQLKAPESWPVVKIDSAYQIDGGEPFLWITNRPIAAKINYGKGTVTVIGFGSRFADAFMGVSGNVIPNNELRQVYELQFRILKEIISGEPMMN